MYDSSYMEDPETHGEDASLAKFVEVLDFASRQRKGVFIDYGCGDGKLLAKLHTLGWDVLGIDFNTDYASSLSDKGIKVIGPDEPTNIRADILHLGDVLEHLIDLETELPKILDLLKTDGYFVAHGPLEGNHNLFYEAMRFGKRFKKNRTRMPPHHVTLSTTRGQKALFCRNGLREITFHATEIAFPASPNLSPNDFRHLRKTLLFFLRKVSQAATKIRLGAGNRYFFIGRKTDSPLGKLS